MDERDRPYLEALRAPLHAPQGPRALDVLWELHDAGAIDMRTLFALALHEKRVRHAQQFGWADDPPQPGRLTDVAVTEEEERCLRQHLRRLRAQRSE